MGIQLKDGRVLSATLCEVERGLFYVTYTMDSVALGKHLLPTVSGWHLRFGRATADRDKSARVWLRGGCLGGGSTRGPECPLLAAEEATRLAH